MGRWLVLGAVAVGMSGACGSDKSAKCEPGTETCACYPNKTCNGDLACLSDLCVNTDTAGAGGSGGTGSGSVGSHTGGSTARGGSSGLAGQAGTGDTTGPGGAGAGNETTGGSGGSGAHSSGTGGTANHTGGTGSGGTSGAGSGTTPVSQHGALAVLGTNLVDSSGTPVQLKGMSSFWLNWDATGYAESKAGLRFMRDNWDLRIFRAAMGVDAMGAYLDDPTTAKAEVNQIVQNAIDLGVYVIIDWHDQNALSHQTDAIAFFDEMSKKWGGYPNVLYEVFNEPLDLDWASELKPYHQALVSAIRANDPDNVILLGTPNWDQDVDVAAGSPLSGTNLMYTLHFYSCSHGASYRTKAQTAHSAGLPLFVSEWGATNADGGVDGVVCESEARAWHTWLDQINASWAAWKLDGCTDSSCMFKDRTVSPDGGWTSADLNGHAPLVIELMSNNSASGTGGTGGSSGSGAMGGSGGTGGSTGGSGAVGTGGTSSDPFPPNPTGCGVIACTGCCQTSGVYALDIDSIDATSQYVTSFNATSSLVSASFSFTGAGETGAVFFKLASPVSIGSLSMAATGSGGSLQAALVANNGADGCWYTVEGATLYLGYCWGLGAGPAGYYAVDQIEARVQSTASGPGAVSVSAISYGP